MVRCVVGAGEALLDEALDEERQAVRNTIESGDMAEGLSAFLEKRRPRFSGLD